MRIRSSGFCREMSMGYRFLRITAIILAIVTTLAGSVYWWVFLRRECQRWTETARLSDGSLASVEFESSSRVYWSFGHAGGFGGGGEIMRTEIHAAGKHYRWTGGDERPFVLGIKDGRVFLAVFDRGDMSRIRYRYYRSNSENRLVEISPTEFPKELAVQNLWLDSEESEDFKRLQKMDPDDYWFRHSLTGRMWLHLVKNVDYFQSDSEDTHPTPQFIAEYKKKYLAKPLVSTLPSVG